jgi:glycosyltransferase involved in cell wall biosynthesis
MNLAIDASPLLEPMPTGVGRVVREVLAELSRRELPHTVHAVSPDRAPRLPAGVIAGNVKLDVLDTDGRPWRGRPAERFVKEHGVNVWWSTVSAFPRGVDCSTVATFHEAPWEARGTRGDEGTGVNHRLWATLDAWFATRVVCPSQATADAFLASNLRKSFKSKVVVVPWGVSAVFKPTLDKGVKTEVENYKFRPDYPYFLMVAAPRRIKNFDLAMRALRIFRDRSGIDARLFLVGPRGRALEEALGYADGLGLRMFVTPFDYVPDAELADLYRGARATLVLSRSEGFGFPVLESMACGTPVLHSGAGSLAEVAGGAGIQVKLDDEESIAADMQRVHADAELRKQLVEKGLAQAAKFTWKSAADRLLGVFSEVGGDVAALAGAGGHGSSH